MNATDEAAPHQPHRMKLIQLLPWVCVLLALVGIVVVRSTAAQGDFALANILTAVFGSLAWLLSVLGLATCGVRRSIWVVLLVLPPLLLAGFLVQYRVERVDGDLVPHFVSRWSEPKILPTADDQQPAVEEIFVARSSDYPQFLGPDRNAMLDSIALTTDWDDEAPQIVWKQTIGEGWSGFAIRGDAAITMEQRDGQEWVSAYHVANGRLLWNYAIDAKHSNVMGGTGPRSTPTIHGDHVYACSAVSRFVCLELVNGEEVWSHELLQLGEASQADFEQQVAWGRSASPLVVDDLAIIPLGGVGTSPTTLVAFDRLTGEIRWRAGQDQISYSSPSYHEIDGVPQIILISESKLAAYAPDDGSELWSTPWPGHSNSRATVSQPVLVGNNQLLLSKGYSQGARLVEVTHTADQWQVTEVWRNETALKTKFTNCVTYQGHAYGLSDGILECVDLKTGERQWKRGRYRQGQLLRVGPHLLITSEAGEIVIVEADPRQHRELASMPVISDVSWNTAAISGDRLLMRNSNEAACVRLPTRNAASQPAHETRAEQGEVIQ